MKLLIIGGTRFLGRHIAEAAIASGHELTLFHRGTTNKGLFDVEEILGDRDGETDFLYGRKWDAVVDTCGYFPRVVEQTADTLSDAVDRYCFISSISVYREGQPAVTESGEVIHFDKPPEKEEITGETYGGLKVLCEEAVASICGSEKTLVIRPGLIVGPHDPSDRFTYWVDRFGSSDEILVPDRPNDLVQFIDARDLARFVLSALEQGQTGTFNATGPAGALTIGELWTALRANCGGSPREVLVSPEFTEENSLQEWSDLPLLLPRGGDQLDVDCRKAIGQGLAFRSLEATIRDTADWHRGRGQVDMRAGLSREREVELLRKWSALA